jgi:hypothetical protein
MDRLSTSTHGMNVIVTFTGDSTVTDSGSSAKPIMCGGPALISPAKARPVKKNKEKNKAPTRMITVRWFIAHTPFPTNVKLLTPEVFSS